jgi:hypothetical protein
MDSLGTTTARPMTYPNPCTHCGLCCLAEPCPTAKTLMGAKNGPCPALEWSKENPDESRCGLITRPEHYLPASTMDFIRKEIPDLPAFLGSNTGCCISARVIGPNGLHEFSPLSPETKVIYTRAMRLELTRRHSPTEKT